MKTIKIISVLLLIGLLINGCVKDEIFQGPPSISDLTITPQAPSENQAVQVNVKVVDLNAVKKVSLFYSVSGGNFNEVQMTASGEMYTAQIPGQSSDVTVNYYILAENESGQKSYFPAGAPQTTAAFTVGAPLIVMNEIYSRGTVEEPDWVEIYNASDVEVNISNYAIYDSGGQSGAKPKLTVPEGTIIAAKGYYVIVTDIGGESGFGLSSGGEEVWFENAAGNVIDNVQFPPMDVTQSYGRTTDGGTNWDLLNTITKGLPNSDVVPDPEIVINEIFSQGDVENPDWIELYNNSAFEADIADWKVYDSGGQSGSKPKFTLPAGSVIAPKGYLIVVVDDESESGFGLSSNGEQIWLESPSGNIVNDITFPALTATQSYGRFPDGTENLQIMETVTRGAANTDAIPAQAVVVMNEVFSRGTTEDPDWVELYNDSDVEINISGWLIYDSGGQSGSKPKKAIPEGTILAARSFYVIVVDDEDPSGFGLSSGGEEIWLEKPDATIADNIIFPALEETQSFGRYPDGSETWQVLETVTRGTANSDDIPNIVAIFMNEIYSRGTAENPDWIEIYNDGSTEIDLTGWLIYDSGGNSGSKPKKEFPQGTIIPAKGFYVIVVDDEDPSGFGLSSGGEEVWLEKPDATIADNIIFPALEETQSYGRYPDGSENLQILETVTPGAANSNEVPQEGAVVMNEIYSRGTADDPDWIEIYNDGNTDIDITGWLIYDSGGNSGSKPKKVFPEGSIIPSKGFLVIVVDDDDPSGFGLSSGGEEVWFEKPDGTIADNVVFPALDVTQSYGRKPDGTDNWEILNTITRGSTNNNAK